MRSIQTGCWLMVAVWLAGPAAASDAADPADHLFLGDHIVTLEDGGQSVSAVAVRAGRIAWVGDREKAAHLRGSHTQIHELGAHALLPGFVDAHGHLALTAMTTDTANLASPPVGPVADLAGLQGELRAYMATKEIPPGEWVMGFGYDDSLLKERRHPTRTELDAVSGEHPIVLLHVSGHLMAGNSLALQTAGITSETPDPEGGTIRREADGRTPGGVVEETATYAFRAVLARPPTADQFERAVQAFARHGVTTIQDGASSPETVAQLEELDAAGRLKVDVVAYPVGMDPKAIPADFAFGTRGRLEVPGIKLVLDGSPQGKTAYLSQPYHVPPEGLAADYRGYPILTEPQVQGIVAHWLGRKIPILAHANGDAAAELLIDAVEAAAPGHDHRTVMIHAQTVREDQLDRMSRLGIIPSFFSTHTFYWGDWHRDSVLGPERAERISPTRSAMHRGMHFTVHNDAPVVPPDMVRLLWATTNRKTRSGRVLGAEQRLTVEEALRAMTVEAAYQSFDEADKGSIAVGKQADLVVLSGNPLETAPAELLELRVEETWSRGERVFAAPAGD
ncbi:MAG: amidohydrolase [Croceicoccus sp.]|nr:amidohydrolase [Croceicoccus sp.]